MPDGTHRRAFWKGTETLDDLHPNSEIHKWTILLAFATF